VQNGVSWMYLRISFPQDDDYGRTQSIYPENTHVKNLLFLCLIRVDGIQYSSDSLEEL